MSLTYSDCQTVDCPNCKTGRLSDDGHDGNVMLRTPDGKIGMWYKGFVEGNWSPTPAGCYSCKSFFTLPDLIQVPFGVRMWVFDKGDTSDENLKTPTGGYYTRRNFVVPVEAKS